MSEDFLQIAEGNFAIFDSFVKAKTVLAEHNKIACSISGGGIVILFLISAQS